MIYRTDRDVEAARHNFTPCERAQVSSSQLSLLDTSTAQLVDSTTWTDEGALQVHKTINPLQVSRMFNKTTHWYRGAELSSVFRKGGYTGWQAHLSSTDTDWWKQADTLAQACGIVDKNPRTQGRTWVRPMCDCERCSYKTRPAKRSVKAIVTELSDGEQQMLGLLAEHWLGNGQQTVLADVEWHKSRQSKAALVGKLGKKGAIEVTTTRSKGKRIKHYCLTQLGAELAMVHDDPRLAGRLEQKTQEETAQAEAETEQVDIEQAISEQLEVEAMAEQMFVEHLAKAEPVDEPDASLLDGKGAADEVGTVDGLLARAEAAWLSYNHALIDNGTVPWGGFEPQSSQFADLDQAERKAWMAVVCAVKANLSPQMVRGFEDVPDAPELAQDSVADGVAVATIDEDGAVHHHGTGLVTEAGSLLAERPAAVPDHWQPGCVLWRCLDAKDGARYDYLMVIKVGDWRNHDMRVCALRARSPVPSWAASHQERAGDLISRGWALSPFRDGAALAADNAELPATFPAPMQYEPEPVDISALAEQVRVLAEQVAADPMMAQAEQLHESLGKLLAARKAAA